MAFRVPTPTVSVVDLTVRTAKDTSYAEISRRDEEGQRDLSQGHSGIHRRTKSSAAISSIAKASSIFDEGSGIELNKRFFKLVSWYDNEWGYSYRVATW